MFLKYTLLAFYLFLLFLFEVAASQVFSPAFYFFPQILLVFVVIFSFRHSFSETLWFSFATGLLSEFFSGFPFGSYVFAFSFSGILTYLATRKLTPREIAFPVSSFLIVLATLLFGLWIYLYQSFASLTGLVSLENPWVLNDFFSGKIWGRLFWNILFLYPVKLIFRFLESFYEKSL